MAQFWANYINRISMFETRALNADGIQNMPNQNMPLWHIDNFELKTLEKQQIQEKHFDLLSFS